MRKGFVVRLKGFQDWILDRGKLFALLSGRILLCRIRLQYPFDKELGKH